MVEISKNSKKAAADKKKATILVKVRWLGEKSALGMCERLQNGSREKRESRHARALALPFLEKYSSYIQVRFKDKVFRGTVFNFFFTDKINFKILNDFFLRSLLYTGPVPVYNYSQGQIVGAKDSKLGEKMAQRKERVEELLPEQLVPNGRVRSGFLILAPENICQGLFSPFFTVLLPVMTFPRPHYVINDAPSCRQPPYSLPDGFVVN